MADKTPKDPKAPFATRIDPTKEGLSQEQLHFIRQVELEQWKKKTQKLRARNVVTGLAIGALVLGISIYSWKTTADIAENELDSRLADLRILEDLHLPDGYTFYSVSQERIMDEIDDEARRARMQEPKTGAN